LVLLQRSMLHICIHKVGLVCELGKSLTDYRMYVCKLACTSQVKSVQPSASSKQHVGHTIQTAWAFNRLARSVVIRPLTALNHLYTGGAQQRSDTDITILEPSMYFTLVLSRDRRRQRRGSSKKRWWGRRSLLNLHRRRRIDQ